MSNLFIAVANHAHSKKKESIKGYYNVLAGATLKDDLSNRDEFYSGYDYFDNEGDNISELNRYFCELTVIYWMFKNLTKYSYYGLVHYRRKFVDNDQKQLVVNNFQEIYDIILPEAKSYFPFNVKTHYSVSHYKNDLDILEKVIAENYPDYRESFRLTMKSNKLHLYNMFIMRKELFQEYSTWLFSVLNDLQDYKIHCNKSVYQSRVYGFLGERLLNIWLRKKLSESNNIKIKYYKVAEINANSRFVRGLEWFLRFFKLLEKK